jgi:hypothetical protein
MMKGFEDGQEEERNRWDGNGGAGYKAFGTRVILRSVLWDAEHPEINLEDMHVLVVKEAV